MTFNEAKALREYQLNGGRVSDKELREAIAVLAAQCPRRDTDDPWGLTPGQRRALEAYIITGSTQAAANALGANYKTISHQLTCATVRIGAGNLLLAAIALDRHIRPTNAFKGT